MKNQPLTSLIEAFGAPKRCNPINLLQRSKLLSAMVISCCAFTPTVHALGSDDAAQTDLLRSLVVNPKAFKDSDYEVGGKYYRGPYGRGDEQAPKNELTDNDVLEPLKKAQAGGDAEGFGIVSNDVLERLKVNLTVTPETTDLLGDNIDLSTGSLSFRHTDISIAGNSGLDVSLSRVFKGSSFAFANSIELGDWQLDIPHIKTTLLWNSGTMDTGKFTGAWGQGRPCSGELNPGPIRNLHYGTHHYSWEYWNGDTLSVPGKVSEKILENSGGTARIANREYSRVTKSNWRIRCEIIEPTNSAMPSTEAFIAESPEGVIYTFSQLKLVKGKPVIKDTHATSRYYAFMRVTKIADRFGNEVIYSYDENNNLSRISSNDEEGASQRQIDLSYITYRRQQYLDKATANGRTWQYKYRQANGGYGLSAVILPNNTQWTFNLKNLADVTPISQNNARCDFTGPHRSYINGEITHPNGVTGSFDLRETLHGRSNVKEARNNTLKIDMTSACFATMSLTRKSLSGPGLATKRWRYRYSQNTGFFSGQVLGRRAKIRWPVPSNIDPLDHKATLVYAPDRSKTVHYFNRDWTSAIEGSEVATRYYEGRKILKEVQNTYSKGEAPGSIEQQYENRYSTQFRSQLDQRDIKQLGDTYTTKFLDYNLYGTYRKTQLSNSIWSTKVKYSKQSYRHDESHWLLNLPTKKQIDASDIVSETQANGRSNVVNETTYYTSAHQYYPSMVYQQKSFGNTTKTYTSYNSRGNVTRIDYPGVVGRYIKLNNYKRGQAQSVSVPRRYTSGSMLASKAVNDNGWVTSTTDLNGNKAHYTYDEIGRIKTIITADNSRADTLFSWGTNENNQPIRTVQQCTLNGDTCSNILVSSETTFDGLFRPLQVKSTDEKTGKTRFTTSRFNVYNKPVFQSYPTLDVADSESGMFSEYDGIQRLKSTSQSGGGIQHIYYEAGNTQRVSNFNQKDTTTTFLAFGAPSYKQALVIASPEGVSTTQEYDVYGNVTRLTQSGGGISQSQINLYDANNQLCKAVRKDVGTTVYKNNIYGETQWLAQGASGATASCDFDSVLEAQKTAYQYDYLGDIRAILYPDNSADVKYERDKQGNIVTLTAGAISHNYQYDSSHALTKETLHVDGKALTLTYGYDQQGALKRLDYPNGDRIDYLPNGFGEPTGAHRAEQNYASSASYYASGMLKSFTYGNGLQHFTTINGRQQPERISDSNSLTTAIDQSYHYDWQGNITSLIDNARPNFSLSELTYDGLDRLKTTKNGSGAERARLNYDALGNITYYKTIDTELAYQYNPTTLRLDSTTGSKGYQFTYDGRGNVTNNGSRGFIFNRANQLTESGSNSYLYDGHNRRVKSRDSHGVSYSFYSQSGQLLYRETNVDESTAKGSAVNYIYLGKKLIAKDGIMPTSLSSLMHYKPFGESVGSDKDDIGYTGHKFDTDLGLSYMQARYYDPVIGRFYSNDPVGYSRNNPVGSFNRYSYVNNNPYKYTDPTGMCFWDACVLETVVVVALVKAVVVVGTAALAGYAASEAINAYNESSSDDFIDDLKDKSEADANSGKSKIRTITDGTTVDEAFDNFPGEQGEASDGSPIKTAQDGTTAHVHDSSKDNGKKTLNIKKPNVKKPIKFREPEAGNN